jgi:D-3-phosphoglycerate dehydrogenase / 2-oxoglutarate reductase
MVVYLADKLPEKALQELNKIGCTVRNEPGATAADLDKGIGDAMVLIVRSTVVTEQCIKNSPNLTLIIRAGAGVNNIDQEAASKYGIFVANCPGQNSIAVAELAIGLMLALDRFLPENVSDFRKGVWNKAGYGKAEGLFGKTLGVIGVGQIGQHVIRRAQAFGMPVVAWSRSLTPVKAELLDVEQAASVEEVASKCDILSVHLALKPETRGIISAGVLSNLKDGAFFINTARAEVVDEEALYKELKSGRIKAGLDVFSEEPEHKKGEVRSRFQELENVYITHHIGASTQQAQVAVAMDAVDIVRGYIQEGYVRNWLNRCRQNDVPWQLIVRHYDKPGVLANVLAELKAAGINAQEMENVIFDGKLTACCTIQLDVRPDDSVIDAINKLHDEVITAVLVATK